MMNRSRSSQDFVDYFFQKEGDTYISQLVALRSNYNDQVLQLLSSNPSLRPSYKEFRRSLLNLEKISPKITGVEEEFSFSNILGSLFADLEELEVSHTLLVLGKYCDFIRNLQEHWKGLELEEGVVIDTSIQLMATLESMAYPLFLKIAEWIGSLAEGGSGAVSPEAIRDRLHMLAEAVVKEIAVIGGCAIRTIGKIGGTTRESLAEDGRLLGAQGQIGKNGIVWVMQAVSPALLYYYLKRLGEEDVEGAAASELPLPPPPPCNCPCAMKSNNGQLPQRKCTGKVEMDQTPAPSSSSPQEHDQEVEVKEAEQQDKQQQQQQHESEDEENVKTSADNAGAERSHRHRQITRRETMKTAEDFKIETGDEHSMDNDFVSYFFKKNGIKYVAVLATTRKKYEERCREMCSGCSSSQRDKLKQFMEALHDVRKISPITRAVEVGDFPFSEQLQNSVKEFKIEIGDKVEIIDKYQTYILDMLRHWNYLIHKDRPLKDSTVVDVSTQMMATTMALTYPIFIRCGEFLRQLGRKGEWKYSPQKVADKLHDLVEANALQVAGIGISGLNIISKLPDMTNDKLRANRELISAQTTLAKNSISWAMKAISPLLLIFYLRFTFHLEPPRGSLEPTAATVPAEDSAKEDEESLGKGESGGGGGGGGVEEISKKRTRGEGEEGEQQQQQQDEGASTPAPAPTPYQEMLHGANTKYYKAPADPKNFVHYFYAKQGQHYSTILTRMRKSYEAILSEELLTVTQKTKDKSTKFVKKYHDARKPSVPTEDVELGDIKFKEAVHIIFQGLNVPIQDNLGTLVKYFEFTKNMDAHWGYRIKKGLELEQDAVLETSIEMEGTTVALAYPIFIKIAEFIIDVMNTGKVEAGSGSTIDPMEMVDRFKKFVFLLTTEMAAIGMCCTGTMSKVKGATTRSVKDRTMRLVEETKIADSAISWAMKAIFPVFMLYFLKYEESRK